MIKSPQPMEVQIWRIDKRVRIVVDCVAQANWDEGAS